MEPDCCLSIVCQLVGQKVYRELSTESALDQAKHATHQPPVNMRKQIIKRHPGKVKMKSGVYCFLRGPTKNILFLTFCFIFFGPNCLRMFYILCVVSRNVRRTTPLNICLEKRQPPKPTINATFHFHLAGVTFDNLRRTPCRTHCPAPPLPRTCNAGHRGTAQDTLQDTLSSASFTQNL